MPRCSRCGAETQLFKGGVPVCIHCDAALGQTAREAIIATLQDNVEAGRRRRMAANRHFLEVMADISGRTVPDGPRRIRQAAREYHDAIKAVYLAVCSLNDFILDGTIPPDLEFGKTQD